MGIPLGSEKMPQGRRLPTSTHQKIAKVQLSLESLGVHFFQPTSRDCPNLPCDVVLDPEEWQAAWIVAHRTK